MYIYIYTFIYEYTYSNIHIYIHPSKKHVSCMYVGVYMYVRFPHTYLCECMYIHLCIYISMRVYKTVAYLFLMNYNILTLTPRMLVPA